MTECSNLSLPSRLKTNPPERFQWVILANPIAPIVETFRYAFLGAGTMDPGYLLYSFVFMLLVNFLGSVIFNRVEQTFMDTV